MLMLNQAAYQHPWQLPTLTRISKPTRNLLKKKLFEQVHLRSLIHKFAKGGWPSTPKLKNDKMSRLGANIANLALYLHLVYREEEIYTYDREGSNSVCMELGILFFGIRNKDQVGTLGLRIFHSTDCPAEYLILCKAFPNLKRLYVDLSAYPTLQDEAQRKENIAGDRDIDTLTVDIPDMTQSLQGLHVDYLEAFAVAGIHPDLVTTTYNDTNIKSQFVGILGQEKLIKTTFGKLKRLYLFGMSMYQDQDTLEKELS